MVEERVATSAFQSFVGNRGTFDEKATTIVQCKHLFRFVFEEFLDRRSHPGAGRTAVIITEENSPGIQSPIEEIYAVHGWIAKVYVNMYECKSTIFEFTKSRRNPTLAQSDIPGVLESVDIGQVAIAYALNSVLAGDIDMIAVDVQRIGVL